MPISHEWLLIHAIADGLIAITAFVILIAILIARSKLADGLGRLVLGLFAASFGAIAIRNISVVVGVWTGEYGFQVVMEIIVAAWFVATAAIVWRLIGGRT